MVYACSDWVDDACTTSGHEFNYEYDGAGNATRFDRWNNTTYQVETVHNVYNGANQLECVDANNDTDCEIADGDTLYTYDDFGNLTAEPNTTYGYDAANRLISVSQTKLVGTVEVTTVTTYEYNGDGDRVSQTVDDGTTEVTTAYLLDVATPLTMVLAEKVGSTVTVMYWHGLDLLGQGDGTTVTIFENQGLGSVRQIGDSSVCGHGMSEPPIHGDGRSGHKNLWNCWIRASRPCDFW